MDQSFKLLSLYFWVKIFFPSFETAKANQLFELWVLQIFHAIFYAFDLKSRILIFTADREGFAWDNYSN